jgi:arylsulfatase A-like enzyme
MQLRPTDDEIYKSLYRDRFGDLVLPATYRQWGDDYRKIPAEVWNGVWISQYDYVKSPVKLRERMVRICQTITGVDRFVGQLREQLEHLGLADNTIIVFSTDHGIHFGEHGIGGKVFMYEEDLRIPLVVHDPRLPRKAAGQRREELVVVEDLAPTVLELCGLDASPGMQGESLVPILEGETPAWRDAFFAENLFDHQNYPRCEAVRTTDWKYIRYFRRTEDPASAGKRIRGTLDPYSESRLKTLRGEEPVYEELYHLAEDPHEETNLADDPAHAAKLAEMQKRIQEEGFKALAGREETDTVDTESSWCVRR